MSICRPLTRPITRPLTRAITESGVGGGGNPELFPAGTFDDAGLWTLAAGWTVTGGEGVGTATTANLTAAISGLVAGETYDIEITVAAYTAGTFRLRFFGGTTADMVGAPVYSAAGTFTGSIVANSGNNVVALDGVSAFTGRISLVSVKKN